MAKSFYDTILEPTTGADASDKVELKAKDLPATVCVNDAMGTGEYVNISFVLTDTAGSSDITINGNQWRLGVDANQATYVLIEQPGAYQFVKSVTEEDVGVYLKTATR